MRTILDYRTAVSIRIILIISCLSLINGCSDPQAKERARLCENAGVTADLVKECRRSWEDYNRIMEPISKQEEREGIAVFNAALSALPTHTIPKDRYDHISLEKLNKEYSGLESVEESEMPKHPLFGKRFRVQGRIGYHPTDFKELMAEHVSFEAEDASDSRNTWSVEADLESLKREERAFIKNHCEYLFDGCHGQIFGVMGPVQRGQLQSLGLRIEYLDISQRGPKRMYLGSRNSPFHARIS
jgi:hypothetical protein